MDCPHCHKPIPDFTDRTVLALKLRDQPNDFLIETARGRLLRIRVTFARHDLEAGLFHYKISVAQAQDVSGDVSRGVTGEHVIFPAFPIALHQDALNEGRISLSGELAAAVSQMISAAEARLFAAEALVSRFGEPREPAPSGDAGAATAG